MNFNINREVKIIAHNSSRGRVEDWREFPSLYSSGLAISSEKLKVDDAVKLTIDGEEFSYSLQNSTTTPFADLINTFNSSMFGGVMKLTEAATAAVRKTGAATFNPWFKNVKAWNYAEPLTIPLRFSFKIGQFNLWEAKKEVALPILALLIPALVIDVDHYTMKGPFHSTVSLLSLILTKNPLSGINNAVQETGGLKSFAESLSVNILQEVRNSTYKIMIGNQFILDYAYCTNADVSLSTATDQYGFPISGSINLKFEGVMPPAYNSNSVARDSARFYDGNVAAIAYPPDWRD